MSTVSSKDLETTAEACLKSYLESNPTATEKDASWRHIRSLMAPKLGINEDVLRADNEKARVKEIISAQIEKAFKKKRSSSTGDAISTQADSSKKSSSSSHGEGKAPSKSSRRSSSGAIDRTSATDDMNLDAESHDSKHKKSSKKSKSRDSLPASETAVDSTDNGNKMISLLLRANDDASKNSEVGADANSKSQADGGKGKSNNNKSQAGFTGIVSKSISLSKPSSKHSLSQAAADTDDTDAASLSQSQSKKGGLFGLLVGAAKSGLTGSTASSKTSVSINKANSSKVSNLTSSSNSAASAISNEAADSNRKSNAIESNSSQSSITKKRLAPPKSSSSDSSSLIVVSDERSTEQLPSSSSSSNAVSSSQSTSRSTTSEGSKQTGKFTAADSAFIIDYIQGYMTTNNVSTSEICACLRDVDSSSKKRLPLWGELYALFPNRTPKSVYQHAIRKFSRLILGENSAWSPEEKEDLKRYVAEHGNDWSKIGKLLGRNHDDCKTAFRNMREREVTGEYSSSENMDILLQINATCKTQLSSSKNLDLKEVSWQSIATNLGDRRTALDYLRHWNILRRQIMISAWQFKLSSDDTSNYSVGYDIHACTFSKLESSMASNPSIMPIHLEKDSEIAGNFNYRLYGGSTTASAFKGVVERGFVSKRANRQTLSITTDGSSASIPSVVAQPVDSLTDDNLITGKKRIRNMGAKDLVECLLGMNITTLSEIDWNSIDKRFLNNRGSSIRIWNDLNSNLKRELAKHENDSLRDKLLFIRSLL